MGSTFKAGFAEIWPKFRLCFEQAKNTGTGVNYSSAQPVLVERRGFREEAFFSGNFIAVGMPQVEGFVNTA
jgi:hypothetical protein